MVEFGLARRCSGHFRFDWHGAWYLGDLDACSPRIGRFIVDGNSFDRIDLPFTCRHRFNLQNSTVVPGSRNTTRYLLVSGICSQYAYVGKLAMLQFLIQCVQCRVSRGRWQRCGLCAEPHGVLPHMLCSHNNRTHFDALRTEVDQQSRFPRAGPQRAGVGQGLRLHTQG